LTKIDLNLKAARSIYVYVEEFSKSDKRGV
jgi:hypothetical protein